MFRGPPAEMEDVVRGVGDVPQSCLVIETAGEMCSPTQVVGSTHPCKLTCWMMSVSGLRAVRASLETCWFWDDHSECCYSS